MNVFSFKEKFKRRFETKYIHLHRRRCQGCGECVQVCPEDVIQLRRAHHHILLKNPEACSGCKKCVRVCENGAIEYTYVAKPRVSQAKTP